MRMKRTMAFLIVLSMIVGLIFAVPASASLSVIENYTEEVLVDENFDGNSYDRNNIYVNNGTVADGTLNFTLDRESDVSYTAALDTTHNAQYVINFDLSTEVAYSDPWTATFVGFNLEEVGQKPYAEENGAWVGITKDKIILWFSNSHSKNAWGSDRVVEGTEYYVFDAPVSFENASFRLIVEDATKELQYKNGDAYEVLATFTVASGNGVFTLADGTTKFTSTTSMSFGGFNTYFSISNQSSAIEIDDPFNPSDDDDDTEPLKVSVDNFVVTQYGQSYITEEQTTTINGLKTTLQTILNEYNTEAEDDDTYKKNSVDAEALEKLIAKIEAKLADDEYLAVDADTLVDEINAFIGGLVSTADVDAYETKLAKYTNYLVDARLAAENGEPFSVSGIDALLEVVTAAYDVTSAKSLTLALMDAKLAEIKKAFDALDLYAIDGYDEYYEPFDATTTASDFDVFNITGYLLSTLPNHVMDGDKNLGAAFGVNFWPELHGRFRLGLKSVPNIYSVKATLKHGAAWTTMVLRALPGNSNLYEVDGTLSAGNKAGIGLYGVQFNHRGSYVDVILKDGEHGGKRVWTTVNVADVPGAQIDTNTVTVLAKDYGETIEFYLVDASDNATKIVTVAFDSLVKNTKFNRNSGAYPEYYSYDCYTDGVMTNHITGESIEFNGMVAPVNSISTVSFQAREGDSYIKDLEIKSKITQAVEKYVDGYCAPSSIRLDVEDTELNVGETTSFSLEGDFEELKVVGREKFKAGTMDITNVGRTSYATLSGKAVINVNKAGTITAVAPGTDILTATYTYTKNGVAFTSKKSVLISVSDSAFTAPADTDKVEQRIDDPYIVNADVFKSIDEGLEIIPVVAYYLFSGDMEYLARDKYAVYNTSDASVIDYDYTKGRYVAKAPGKAEIWVDVHTEMSVVSTKKVSVEVTPEGEMTPGLNTSFAVQSVLEAAQNLDDYTVEELKKVVDNANKEGMSLPYTTDADILLMFAAFAELDDDATIDDVNDAYNDSLRAGEVYDIINNETSTSADLAEYFFGKYGTYEDFDIDNTAYGRLSSSKQARAMTRIFTQLDKDGTDLTVSSIKKVVEDIVDMTAEGGSSGRENNKNTTSSGLGGFTPTAPGTQASVAKKDRVSKEVAEEYASKFADIDQAAWAKIAIGNLAYEKAVAGYEDGTIRPNDTITRDEFVKLLIVAFNFRLKNIGEYYSDIAEDAWQKPYVNAALVEGIATGIADGVFGTGLEITREDMAVMIVRVAEKLGIKLDSTNKVSFADESEISGYAVDAVNKLAANGIISGMGNNTFAPKAPATRAQAMYIINTLKDLMK